MKIIDAEMKFKGSLTKRKITSAVILHHMAAQGSVQSIHNTHLNFGWAGIGYNFFIRLDGSIYKGRGWDYIGAHAGASSGYNAKSVGICFEGDYTKLSSMPAAQYEAGVWLVREALKRYGRIDVLKHRDVAATVCPGNNFPFTRMKEESLRNEEVSDMSDKPSAWAKTAWEAAVKAGITDGTRPQAPATREEIITMLYRAGIIRATE